MSQPKQSQQTWLIVGVGIGLVFLAIALAKADFRGAGEVLARTDARWIVVVLLSALAFMALKSLRWLIALRPVLGTQYNFLHQAVYIGTAANLIVAHTGELLRATLVARRENASSSAILATIAIERVLDFTALLMLASVALIIDPRMSTALWAAGQLSLGIVVAALLTLKAILNPSPRLRSLSDKLLEMLPPTKRNWLVNQFHRGIVGLSVLRQPSSLILLVALSLVQWGAIVTAIWASAEAVGVAIPWSAAIAVFVLTVVGLTLPSAPAQLGTLQLAFVVGLELSSASPTAAFAASIVYTCFVNVTMMIVGAACWIGASSLTNSSRSNTS